MSGFNTFSSLSPEDLWAITGISFASPVRDILEKEDFTLEDLLMESELIQEVKSGNKQLHDFLTKDDTMAKIIKYLSVPAAHDIDMDTLPSDNDIFKFPYICSELISCEIHQILSCIVEEADGTHIKNYLKILDAPTGTLDPILSGYMEKIFETLLRHFPGPMFTLLNADNCSLSLSFLRHTDNFSIVQILQRLLLPHIPYSAHHEDFDRSGPSSCEWAHSKDFCMALVETFLKSGGSDMTLHLNELLINVIQLSPVSSPFVENLSSDEVVAPMCAAIKTMADSFAEKGFVPEDNLTLGLDIAVITVIDCLVSKFNDSIPVLEDDVPLSTPSSPTSSPSSSESARSQKDLLTGKINGICRFVVDIFPVIVDIVIRCGQDDARTANPRFGSRRLAIVKLVQALLVLGNPAIDEQISSSRIIPQIINMMFTFPRHSVLHLTVQRIILLVIEDFDSANRKDLFASLVSDAALISRIMDFVKSKQPTARQSHNPLLGHLYDIGKVLMYGLNSPASKGSSSEYDPASSEAYVRKFRDAVSSCVDLDSWDKFVDESFRELIRRNSTTSSSLDNSMMSDKTADYETPLGSKDDDYNSSNSNFGGNDWGDSRNQYKNGQADYDDEDADEEIGQQGFAPDDDISGTFDSPEDLFANFEDSKAFDSVEIVDSTSGVAAMATDTVFDPFKAHSSFQDSDSSSSVSNSNSSSDLDPFASSSSESDPFN